MSYYRVEVPKSGWSDWEQLVLAAKIKFERKQFKLGERLFAQNEAPKSEHQIVSMDTGGCSSTSVDTLLRRPRWGGGSPIHPAVVLALAAALPWERVTSHMEYQMAMSPYLLTSAEGRNYIFLLHRGPRAFQGEFKDIMNDDWLPRCMHIWGYPPKEEENNLLLYRQEANGKYGRYYAVTS